MTSPLAQMLLFVAIFLAVLGFPPAVAALIFLGGIVLEVTRNLGIARIDQ